MRHATRRQDRLKLAALARATGEAVLTLETPGAQMAALISDARRAFAAAGSLHLIGPAGLPALLAARGFTVERVDFGR